MMVAIVPAGQAPILRSYGMASRVEKTPIDPVATKTLIGSISKTFTGLAVAKLVEQGAIRSIDEPANRYLRRYRLPAHSGREITIKDLLTHSAGIGFTNRGLGAVAAVEQPLSAAEVSRRVPATVREPGRLVSYSNVATAMLGVMVEDVTGKPIEDMLRGEIWKPMGLNDAHFHRALSLEPGTLKAERFRDGAWTAKPFIAFDPFYYPVGAVSMTLPDAARYAAFHLDGVLGRPTAILGSAGIAAVQSRLRTNHPAVGGFGFQLMNFPWGRHTIVGHGGTWPGYESMLMVMGDRQLAIFYTIAGPGKMTNLRANNLILSELYGPAASPATPRQLPAATLAAFEGIFAPTLRPMAGAERLFNLLAPQTFKVTAKDGGLMLGDQGPFLSVGENIVWKDSPGMGRSNAFGASLFAFTFGDDGKALYLTHEQGLTPYERIAWWQDTALQARVLNWLGLAGLLGVAALAWRRKGLAGWSGRISAVLIGPLLLAILPVIAVLAGPRGFEAYLIEGRAGGFILSLVLAHLAAVAGAILVSTALFAPAASEAGRSWEPAHRAAMGVIGAATILVLAWAGILGTHQI